VKPSLVPYLVRREEDGAAVTIQWDEAGHAGRYAARDLRLACLCAECSEEMTRRPLLDPASVPADVRVLSLDLVGAYAVHFTFSDGHTTGIYPWDHLLSLCPCERCRAARSA
jgi:ATP-binding protein involved in chromosome partitioning